MGTGVVTAGVVWARAGVGGVGGRGGGGSAGAGGGGSGGGGGGGGRRGRGPNRERSFRTPLAFVVGPLAALGCIYLFISLPHTTQLYFLIWNVVGLVLYFLYSRRNALIAK